MPVSPLSTMGMVVDSADQAWRYVPPNLIPLGSTNPGTTAPANPQLGWLWWDSGVNELKVWNGTTWMAASGGGSGGIGEPTTAGSFLRTNTGTWVAGLPLTGGTLTGSITFNDPTGGSSLGINFHGGGQNLWSLYVIPQIISGNLVLENPIGRVLEIEQSTNDVSFLTAVTIPNLILPVLPTVDPGVSGAVWNNGGVLNISP